MADEKKVTVLCSFNILAKTYIVGIRYNHFIEEVLTSTHNLECVKRIRSAVHHIY